MFKKNTYDKTISAYRQIVTNKDNKKLESFIRKNQHKLGEPIVSLFQKLGIKSIIHNYNTHDYGYLYVQFPLNDLINIEKDKKYIVVEELGFSNRCTLNILKNFNEIIFTLCGIQSINIKNELAKKIVSPKRVCINHSDGTPIFYVDHNDPSKYTRNKRKIDYEKLKIARYGITLAITDIEKIGENTDKVQQQLIYKLGLENFDKALKIRQLEKGWAEIIKDKVTIGISKKTKAKYLNWIPTKCRIFLNNDGSVAMTKSAEDQNKYPYSEIMETLKHINKQVDNILKPMKKDHISHQCSIL